MMTAIIIIKVSVTPTAVIVIEAPPAAVIIVSPATTAMFMLLVIMTPAARDVCQLFVSEFDFYLWLDMCIHSKHSFQVMSVFSINNTQLVEYLSLVYIAQQ
jgi:hypothetical protein